MDKANDITTLIEAIGSQVEFLQERLGNEKREDAKMVFSSGMEGAYARLESIVKDLEDIHGILDYFKKR